MINHKTLRQLRLKRGLTQGHAAKAIGIQQSYLSKLENDQAIASMEILQRICDVYSCQITDIAQIKQHQIKTPVYTTKLSYFGFGLILLGLLLIALAFFGIIQNNTAYTYELVSADNSITIAPNFIVTDEFMGEKYQELSEGVQASYMLIGERSISPLTNRIFYFMGVSLGLLGLALQTVRLVYRKKRN